MIVTANVASQAAAWGSMLPASLYDTVVTKQFVIMPY